MRRHLVRKTERKSGRYANRGRYPFKRNPPLSFFYENIVGYQRKTGKTTAVASSYMTNSLEDATFSKIRAEGSMDVGIVPPHLIRYFSAKRTKMYFWAATKRQIDFLRPTLNALTGPPTSKLSRKK